MNQLEKFLIQKKYIWQETEMIINGYKEGLKIHNFFVIHIYNLLNDIVHGEYKKWYKKDQMYMKQRYINYKLNGKCIDWHDNGKINNKLYYKYGLLNGVYQNWNKYGQSIFKIHYINGKCM